MKTAPSHPPPPPPRGPGNKYDVYIAYKSSYRRRRKTYRRADSRIQIRLALPIRLEFRNLIKRRDRAFLLSFSLSPSRSPLGGERDRKTHRLPYECVCIALRGAFARLWTRPPPPTPHARSMNLIVNNNEEPTLEMLCFLSQACKSGDFYMRARGVLPSRCWEMGLIFELELLCSLRGFLTWLKV